MKIVVKESEYFSQKDEDMFYQVLEECEGFISVSGSFDQITIEFNDVICDESLRTLLGLFMRYEMDMSTFHQFLTKKNKRWFFDNKEAYWHKKVWSDQNIVKDAEN